MNNFSPEEAGIIIFAIFAWIIPCICVYIVYKIVDPKPKNPYLIEYNKPEKPKVELSNKNKRKKYEKNY